MANLTRESPWVYKLGLLFLLYLTMKILHSAYKFYVTYFTDSTIDFAKLGKWAVVTGSTDGIGKAIAEELAKRNINIFLISKDSKKLQIVAKKIENQYGVETKTFAFNFTRFDLEAENISPYDGIAECIKDIEVGILVNNVGMPSGDVREFHISHPPNQSLSTATNNQIHCNASSRAKMTEIVLPCMMQRRKGLIINISSMSASHPHPIVSTYAAAKRFDDTLSLALVQEYRKYGITIQSIQPGFVQTNLTKVVIKETNLAIPDAATFARHMMKTIGKSDMTSGYWFHAIVRWVYIHLPEDKLARSLLSTFKSFRK